MPTEDDQQHSVNDISHLFLSNVRSLSGNGMPRPQRKPPGSHSLPAASTAATTHSPAAAPGTVKSVDLTPEELAHVFGSGSQRPSSAEAALAADAQPHASAVKPTVAEQEPTASGIAPVTALLASHLGARQIERARDYARHLAASGERIGLIDLDMSEFRLSCFNPIAEPGVDNEPGTAAFTEVSDPREIAEALEELNVDVDRWLLLLPNLRTPEAREMLGHCQSWTLLTTCDHDGIVSAYRTLKGLMDGRNDQAANLVLATLDAAGDAEAARVQQKLSGVCQKFLGRQIQAETPVRYAAGVAEHPLMNCRVTRDKAQLASAPHWTVVSQMLSRAQRSVDMKTEPMPAKNGASLPSTAAETSAVDLRLPPAAELREPTIRRVESGESAMAMAAASATAAIASVASSDNGPASQFAMPQLPSGMSGIDDVIDLPGDARDVGGILSAVLRRPEFGVIECPLAVPGCAAGRLAISRDRGLTLVAVASHGLSELRSIGRAYQWMLENQPLIAMAMPQFALDPSRRPSVLLLVDQSDVSGELLRPLMQAGNVVVRAYRTLRWAGRTGLLLEAA